MGLSLARSVAGNLGAMRMKNSQLRTAADCGRADIEFRSASLCRQPFWRQIGFGAVRNGISLSFELLIKLRSKQHSAATAPKSKVKTTTTTSPFSLDSFLLSPFRTQLTVACSAAGSAQVGASGLGSPLNPLVRSFVRSLRLLLLQSARLALKGNSQPKELSFSLSAELAAGGRYQTAVAQSSVSQNLKS